jgi:hypothetical protein
MTTRARTQGTQDEFHGAGQPNRGPDYISTGKSCTSSAARMPTICKPWSRKVTGSMSSFRSKRDDSTAAVGDGAQFSHFARKRAGGVTLTFRMAGLPEFRQGIRSCPG